VSGVRCQDLAPLVPDTYIVLISYTKKSKNLNSPNQWEIIPSDNFNTIERIWLTMKARWFNNHVCKN